MEPTIIHCESLVAGNPESPNYLTGQVALRWGSMSGQLSVADAQALAMRIHAVAAGADQDALLIRFLMQRLDQTLEAAAAVLKDFRAMRG